MTTLADDKRGPVHSEKMVEVHLKEGMPVATGRPVRPRTNALTCYSTNAATCSTLTIIERRDDEIRTGSTQFVGWVVPDERDRDTTHAPAFAASTPATASSNTASWHLWRDHRVFVPFATIQNWVEAAGGKKGGDTSDLFGDNYSRRPLE